MEVTEAITSDTMMVRVAVDVEVMVVVEVMVSALMNATKRESNNAARAWNCILKIVSRVFFG